MNDRWRRSGSAVWGASEQFAETVRGRNGIPISSAAIARCASIFYVIDTEQLTRLLSLPGDSASTETAAAIYLPCFFSPVSRNLRRRTRERSQSRSADGVRLSPLINHTRHGGRLVRLRKRSPVLHAPNTGFAGEADGFSPGCPARTPLEINAPICRSRGSCLAP